MLPQRRFRLALLALPLALAVGCDKVPLLAPTGSVITLLATTNTVSLNSEVDIIATVIENGQAAGGSGGTGTSRPGAGTPVQNGTLITFTTTIGRIEPAEARTHNGQVTVKLITAGTSGTATVTAFSGGASASLNTLKIGTAAAKTVTVAATPQQLGASGGTAQVTASVVDEGGSPIGGVPVAFSADKGSLSPSTATTDNSGSATATLTTTATAKVTAAVGALLGTATVLVNARGLSAFSANPTSASAGVPIAFSVTPTAGVNLSNVHIDFGDGSGKDLGAITGTAATTVPHSYTSSGTFTATATSTDTTGDTGSLSTTVLIASLSVTLTPSSFSPTVNQPVTFTATFAGSPQVDGFTFFFDDGTPPQQVTSPAFSHPFTTRGTKTVRVDVFGVGGGKLGTATTQVVVQ